MGGYGVDIISVARGRQVGGNAILSSQSRGRGSNTRAGWWVRGRCPRGCYPLSSLFPSAPSSPSRTHRPPPHLTSPIVRSPILNRVSGGWLCEQSWIARLNLRGNARNRPRSVSSPLRLVYARFDSPFDFRAISSGDDARWFCSARIRNPNVSLDFKYSDLWKSLDIMQIWTVGSGILSVLFFFLVEQVERIIWNVETFGWVGNGIFFLFFPFFPSAVGLEFREKIITIWMRKVIMRKIILSSPTLLNSWRNSTQLCPFQF